MGSALTITVQSSPVTNFSLSDFEANVASPLSRLVNEYGVVYVTSITRDGCSGCEEQKPLFGDLATKLSKAYDHKLSFNNIHIRYDDADHNESARAKRIVAHGSYPTYMIHITSHYGPLEHYRAAYPRIEDLERQAVDALELAAFYKEQSTKAKD